MDVIVLGVYNAHDMNLVNNILLSSNDIKVIWEFDKYNVEAKNGIKILEKYFNLFHTGILVEGQNDETFFSSYPLIYEISEYYITTELYKRKSSTPKLFNFFKLLEKSNFNNFIVAIADEWLDDSTVKIEKIELKDIKKRLNSIYVWCDGYINLLTNSEIRDDFHPLILEVSR